MHPPAPLSRAPSVYLLMIAVNVVVYLAQLTQGVDAMAPSSMAMIAWGANVAPLTRSGDAWRLLSSMFLHVGLLHLAVNMYLLMVFGPVVERQFGRLGFTLLYLLSGLFGSLLSAEYRASTAQIAVAAGASGALMGICGAFIGHWIVAGAHQAAQQQIRLRGPLVQTVGINLVLGFINPGVDNACHVGGLISGIALGAAFALVNFHFGAARRVAAAVAISGVSLGCIYFAVTRPPTPALARIADQLREQLER